jgi:hypothetical protein
MVNDLAESYQGLSELAEDLLKKYENEKMKSETLYGMLQKCEWSARKIYKNDEIIRYCPICRSGDNKGHKKDCLLNKVLEVFK